MQSISWHFSKVQPSRKNREAIIGEFFAANKNIASSLVREAIQNSLDARNDNDDIHGAVNDSSEKPPVKIRIYFSGTESALPWDRIKVFFEDAWEHYTADDNGLRTCPEQSEECKFLVIEDFNTTGLNGNIREYIPPVGEAKNPFYSFFRAEGQSNKSHTDRGRWGVGKFVFAKASRIKTFFGLTDRSEDRKQFLVGQCILKSHQINGSSYIPDGWYGWTEDVLLDGEATDYLHMPIDSHHNQTLIDNFRETFNIKRQDDPGLSIVVPFVDDDINCNELVKAVLDDYFWPILTGELYVTIECHSETYQIESGSLSDIYQRFEDEQTDGMKPQIDLAKWATSVSEEDFITLKAPKATAPAKWTDDLIDTELQVTLRNRLEAEDMIAIRVPITIREQQGDGKGSETFYSVFIQRNAEAKKGSPVFIREGIIIPDIRCPKTPRTVALVVADDPVIADFLGNAENPAHTDWHHNSDNFKDKYYYGHSILIFVKKTVSSIIKIIDESSKQEDKTLLLDFFSIPVPSEGPKRESKKRKNKEGEKTEEPELDIKSKAKRFKVTRVQGGFTVSSADKPVSLPAVLDIKVFYDKRGGKAKYSPHDFKLDKPPIKFSGRNVKINGHKDNQLKVEITDREFSLTVKGFDTKRDLYVDPKMIEQEVENAKI